MNPIKNIILPLLCLNLALSCDATEGSGYVPDGNNGGKPKTELLNIASNTPVRIGGQDGVHTSRIPGLVTTKKGTLIAIFDARYDSSRDLQGDMDIAMHRSVDGGKTWEKMTVILDMGTLGGLPERFNGVSDPCILVDEVTGEIFVFAAWMHGIIDPATKKWVEGITEMTDLDSIWEHHWTRYASLPGFGLKETTQFVMVSSTDDGKTWSKPQNITEMVKPESYHLLCPCPGRGITMSDGTLVVPVSGRDSYTDTFASIIMSEDHGRTWKLAPRNAYSTGGESTVVELGDGSIMLNTHLRSNKGLPAGQNGRGVVVSSDKGNSWKLHPTDHTLIEPPCEASLHKHYYTAGGERKSILFFFNPRSVSKRVNMTLQVSFDDGMTWSDKDMLLVDKGPCNGYSSMTSIDENTLGILYESSTANLSFAKIEINAK